MLELEVMRKYQVDLEERKLPLLSEQGHNVLVKGKTGSGKTYLLLSRIAYLLDAGIADEHSMLNMTTSAHGAKAMVTTFRRIYGNLEIQPQFHDVHQIAYRLIRFYDHEHTQETWKAYRDMRRLMLRLIKDMYAVELTARQLSVVMERISYCRNMMLAEREIEQEVVCGIELLPFMKSYEKYKQRHHIYDYDDLLVNALEILMNHPDILEVFRQRYRFIHIDDAQNLSYLSHMLIKALSEHAELFMCADMDLITDYEHAAYKDALTAFTQTYPESQEIELPMHYRCNKTIAAAAGSFFYQNEHALACVREDTCDIRYKGFADMVKLYAYALRKANEDALATAFLYHDFANAIPLMEALKANDIDFTSDVNMDHFTKHFYVKDMCNFIELMIDARDMHAFYEVYLKMGLEVSKRVMLEISERLKEDDQIDIYQALMESNFKVSGKKKLASIMENIRLAQQLTTEKLIYFIQEKLHYTDILQEHGLTQSDAIVVGFAALAQRYENPEEFLYKLNELNDLIVPNVARVQIRSIRNSVGTEYERVCIIDCIQSIIPGNDADPETLRRARELFFLGMTRAKDQLEFLSAKRCSLTRLEISSFLYEMNSEAKEEHDKRVGPTVKKKLRESAIRRGVSIRHKALGEGLVLQVKEGMMNVQFAEETKQFSVKMCIANKLIELL